LRRLRFVLSRNEWCERAATALEIGAHDRAYGAQFARDAVGELKEP
jgi:hypothetical protein